MRPLVIITYRDRRTHLDVLLLYMGRYFPHLQLCVVEQADDGKWNKGLLYNAAYREVGYEYDYMILSDVDFVPSRTVDYSYTPQPTLLSTECSQFGYGQCYSTFFGGVVGISREHYELINGFSNQFRGWGAEDDDLRRRCIGKGLTPMQRPGNRFENFIHPRLDVLGRDRDNPDYLHNINLMERGPDYSDGLSTAEYTVVSNQKFPECISLKVKTII